MKGEIFPKSVKLKVNREDLAVRDGLVYIILVVLLETLFHDFIAFGNINRNPSSKTIKSDTEKHFKWND